MPHPIGLLLQHPLAQIPTACSSTIHLVALSSRSSTPDTTTYGSGREISQLVLTNPRRPSDRVMHQMTSVYVLRWRNKLQPSLRTHLGEYHWLITNYTIHFNMAHLQHDKLHFAVCLIVRQPSYSPPSNGIHGFCNMTGSISRFI